MAEHWGWLQAQRALATQPGWFGGWVGGSAGVGAVGGGPVARAKVRRGFSYTPQYRASDHSRGTQIRMSLGSSEAWILLEKSTGRPGSDLGFPNGAYPSAQILCQRTMTTATKGLRFLNTAQMEETLCVVVVSTASLLHFSSMSTHGHPQLAWTPAVGPTRRPRR